MIAGDLALLAECVCAELVATGGGPTCWCGVWPTGQVPLEFCQGCDSGGCGMAWVSLAQVFPYSTYPVGIGAESAVCASPIAAQVFVGVVRCMPVADERGNLPPPEAFADVNDTVVADMLALRTAISCCGIEDIRLGQWDPIGPQGGCVGGRWTIFVDVG